MQLRLRTTSPRDIRRRSELFLHMPQSIGWKTLLQSLFFPPWKTRRHPMDFSLVLCFSNQWSSAELSACSSGRNKGWVLAFLFLEHQLVGAGGMSAGSLRGAWEGSFDCPHESFRKSHHEVLNVITFKLPWFYASITWNSCSEDVWTEY